LAALLLALPSLTASNFEKMREGAGEKKAGDASNTRGNEPRKRAFYAGAGSSYLQASRADGLKGGKGKGGFNLHAACKNLRDSIP